MQLKFYIEMKTMVTRRPTQLECVQRCEFCGRGLKVSALSFAENPYCLECLPERIAQARAGAPTISWTLAGDYLRTTDLTRRKLQ